ncbi:hypothetical protein F6X40_10785 [Paraburkholderia sp. UCT31]|uniref:DUF5640 domain-containing protein n=1 Tax=Paraburkholderia sp. UCT31 TaxID=2615209 RepID=UPI00165643E9|nr:DUF5640 domain-containing protein [Paraburkholderia sp. UCT31]MBC8737294.1 hypothetical protein [Paraburkholderia sp. UCT31]
MKRLIATLFLMASTAAFAAPSLVGTWHSDDTSGGNTSGSMTFKKDGTIVLAPDGFPAATGTYKVQGPYVDIDLGAHGKATMAYHFNRDGSTLDTQYSEGTHQSFNRMKQKVK